MKREKIIFLFTALILGLFLISFASAAVGTTTLSSPASSATINGTAILNATITNVANNFTCSFYAQSTSTSNSSWVILASSVNGTTINANTTFNTKGLQDSNDYSFNATCSNNTNKWSGGVNTNIVINNSIPTAPASLTPANLNVITASGSQTFSSAVVDVNTTSCTYIIGRGGTSTSSADTTSGTATYSASTCSFTKTFSSSSDSGNWYWYITASDGSDTASSSVNNLQVQLAPVGGTPYEVVQQIQKTGTVKKSFYIGESAVQNAPYLIGFLVVAIIIFFVARRK